MMSDENGANDYIDDEEYFDVEAAAEENRISAAAEEKPRLKEFFDDQIIADELAFLKEGKIFPEQDPKPANHYAEILKKFAPEHPGNNQTDPSPGETDQPPGQAEKPQKERDHFLFGLALSGGGIRSATFSLGVMQRLAGDRILSQVDYLSTVSGGGYIGSALTWWLNGKHEIDEDTEKKLQRDHFKGCNQGSALTFNTSTFFPWGIADPKRPNYNPNPILRYLRQNGKYLTPGEGLTLTSGVVILLRAIFLNLLVWIPLVALAFGGLVFLGKAVAYAVNGLVAIWMPDINSAINAPDYLKSPLIFTVFLIIAGLILIAYFMSSINYSTLQFTNKEGFSASIGDARDDDPSEQSPGEVVSLGEIRTKLVNRLRLKTLQRLVGSAGEKFRSSRFSKFIGAGFLVLTIIVLFFIVVSWIEVLLPALQGQASVSGVFERIVGTIGVSEASLANDKMTTVKRQSNAFWYYAWFPLALVSIWYVVKGLNERWKLFGWSRILIPLGTFAACMGLAKLVAELDMGRAYAVFCIIVAVGLFLFYNFWVAELVRWLYREDETDLRYGGRRQFEIEYGRFLTIALCLAVVGSVPVVHGMIEGWFINQLEGGIGGIVLGAASTVWGFFRAPTKEGSGGLGNLVLVLGACLFLFGVMLIGYDWSLVFYHDDGKVWVAVLLAFAVLSVLTGYLTNINFISLNRFYRDRLMEAFMPDFETVCEGRNRAATGADTFQMGEVGGADKFDSKTGRGSEQLHGPYHLINTNVLLNHAVERKYRQRKGDNFVVSPLYVGGNATGWGRTSKFMDGQFSVATAMSASAAAANPGGGAGGKGATTHPAVALVMRLLNIRLSCWVRHPRETMRDDRSKGHRRKSIMSITPNHFMPGFLYSLPWFGYKKDDYLLELSDGAHFENLGIYELIRRRCGLIIVCDGGQDNKASYSDLITAIERIGEDFGATINFDVQTAREQEKEEDGLAWEETLPDDLIGDSSSTDHFPKGAEYAKKGYFIARIDYGERGEGGAWRKSGILIYLKTSMIRSLELEAKGYKGAHPDFPDETTGDQFFEEEQFEAYREVGYRIADEMIDDLKLSRCFETKRPCFSELISPRTWTSNEWRKMKKEEKTKARDQTARLYIER